MTAATDEGEGTGDVRELRLALVFYGGVSLAIYMHGITKEIHRLVQASEREHRSAPPEPDQDSTIAIYRRLLKNAAERDEVRTRVVVDVIAGTSAGGINGVYLAKALAHNLSQDGIRDLWIKRGAIARLLGPPHVPFPVNVPFAIGGALRWAPLKGQSMARWLYEALEQMDDAPRPDDEPSLMPDGHELELFVTATDLHGLGRNIALGEPATVYDNTHRHVMTFRRAGDPDDFVRGRNGWLAMAARMTSSFPGAFGAVSVGSIAKAIGTQLHDGDRFFRAYTLAGRDFKQAYFIDGGVLDNRPFTLAIDAIRRRPAAEQVDRKLLYLEPDPAALATGVQRPGPHGQGTVLTSALMKIPRVDSIGGDILAVRRQNAVVARVRGIIESTFKQIRDEVAAGKPIAPATDPAYVYLKLGDVVERYAGQICARFRYPQDTEQADFVRQVLAAWAKDHVLPQKDSGQIDDDQIAFLKAFDVDYGQRRLQFVIDALSWWYKPLEGEEAPTRQELDAGKQRLYELSAELDEFEIEDDVAAAVESLFGEDVIAPKLRDPEAYAKAEDRALSDLAALLSASLDRQFAGLGERMDAEIETLIREWPEKVRADVRARYYGFPRWDAMLYPVQALADAGERDAVEVVRMSPDENRYEKLKELKLSGRRWGHFGAFFTRGGRESDYVRGRIDGADRLSWLLVGDDLRPVSELFAAIAREESRLQGADRLLNAVRKLTARQ